MSIADFVRMEFQHCPSSCTADVILVGFEDDFEEGVEDILISRVLSEAKLTAEIVVGVEIAFSELLRIVSPMTSDLGFDLKKTRQRAM